MRILLGIMSLIVALAISSGSSARTLPSSGTASSITTDRLHVRREESAILLNVQGRDYEVLVPRRFDDAPDLAEYAGRAIEEFFARKRVGDRVAFECVPGFDMTLVFRVTPYGLPANYSIFECYGMNSSYRWYVTVPNGVRQQIEEEVRTVGGTAAQQGLFGPRGSVVFIGFVNEYCFMLTCYKAITTEHWLIAGNVNDLGETIRQGSYDAGAAADFWRTVLSLGIIR